MSRLKIGMPKLGKVKLAKPAGGLSMKRYLLGAATLCCAFGVGYVMQFGVPFTGHGGSGKPVTVGDIQLTSSGGAMHKSTQVPSGLVGATVDQASAEFSEAPTALAPIGQDGPSGFQSEVLTQPTCDISMTAVPAAGAMVDLMLLAPCNAGERVTLHHSGMMFTDTIEAEGSLHLKVPALAENAVFIAALADGSGASASAQVNSLSFYDRVVVQWKGPEGLQLHAREFTDSYFDEGHVWASNAGDLGKAARGEGGFLVTLGSETTPESMMAEVYSFPSGTARRGGDVHMTVEAEVMASNCGKQIEAQTFQLGGDQPLKVHDLTLDMPGCDAVGDFLVLKNIVQDLTIAAR